MSSNTNIVKYKKGFHLNIGVIIFIIIFCYLIFNIFSYFTLKHIAIYEVEQGTIVENNIYHGLILRDENVYNSDFSGEVNYYLKDGSKASVKSFVYSVDENGSISNMIHDYTSQATGLDKDSFTAISQNVSDFNNSYDATSFFSIYSFKDSLDSEIMEAFNMAALEEVRSNDAYTNNQADFHFCTATVPGVVTYYVDGFENITMNDFKPDMLNELNYSKNNLKASTSVKAGDPVYKSVNSEIWNIIIQVDNDTYASLADDDTIKIRFKEDNQTAYATYEFKNISGNYYMFLTFNNSMIRYVKDRYIDIELLLDEQTGLKIPNSSITEKEFFTVPKEYFCKGGDSSDYGVMKRTAGKNGTNPSLEFIKTSLYYEADDCYYIAEDSITDGDILQMPDSSQTYTIHDRKSIKGVYNVNKGYAVFKVIKILFQNSEYTIVDTGTNYGISLYDHIALEGTKVTEDEMVN